MVCPQNGKQIPGINSTFWFIILILLRVSFSFLFLGGFRVSHGGRFLIYSIPGRFFSRFGRYNSMNRGGSQTRQEKS